jgi:hypothetical protein
MKRCTSQTKFTDIFLQVFPASLPDVYADIYQRVLVDESGMIRAQMRTHNGLEIVAV